MAISSKELAKKLGVSPSAVSIALNAKKGVSDETRRKILAAAAEHGLEKPRREPVEKTSRYINLVIFKKHGLVVGDTPFFAELIENITLSARGLSYHTQLTYFYASQSHLEQIGSINSSGCVGVILLATEMSDEDMRIAEDINVPMVVLDANFESTNLDCVVINNISTAYQATKYLIDMGHRKIGHLASKVDIVNFRERREGFVKAVEGLMATSGSVHNTIRVDSTSDGAYRDMTRFLAQNPKLPTAFFADNDIIAIACIRALKEAGYAIPRAVSVIGVDDMPMSRIVSPKLTTMHVARDRMGKCAVERLHEKIERPSRETLKIAVNTWLQVAESVERIALD